MIAEERKSANLPIRTHLYDLLNPLHFMRCLQKGLKGALNLSLVTMLLKNTVKEHLIGNMNLSNLFCVPPAIDVQERD